jgi:hypothetical protein
VRVERVQVGAHGGDGAPISSRLVHVDEWRMTHPEAEQETLGMVSVEVGVDGGDLLRIVCPDVEDGGGDDDLARRPQHGLHGLEHRPTSPARNPQRPVTELLELRSRLDRLCGSTETELPAPDAYGA